MPVYQDRGPGLGDALQTAVQNALMMRRQRTLLGMQQQEAADAHTAATDAHQQREIENAINYGYVDPQNALFSLPAPKSAPTTSSAGDSFESALTDAMGGGAMADGGKALPYKRDALNIPGHPALRAGSATPAADPGAQFEQNLTDSFANRPSQRVMLSNGATIDPYAGFRRQLMLKQGEARINANADIYKSNETGQTDEHRANTALAYRNIATPRLGDVGYASAMGDVAGAEASARLPYEKALEATRFASQQTLQGKQQSFETAIENVRLAHQSALQKNAQDFETGKISKAEQFQRDLQESRLAQEYLNSIQEAGFKEGASLTAGVARRINGASPLGGTQLTVPPMLQRQRDGSVVSVPAPGTQPSVTPADTQFGAFGAFVPKRKNP